MKLLNFRNRRGAEAYDVTQKREFTVLEHKNYFYSECCFNEMLSLERRRTERTKKPICLMLFNVENLFSLKPARNPYSVMPILASSIREIDICGWHKFEKTIGIVFTALDEVGLYTSIDAIKSKLRGKLLQTLTPEMLESIEITCHIFPEEYDIKKPDSFINSRFYPDAGPVGPLKSPEIIKRVMDIVGGSVAIILFSPAFLLISLLIKATSKGPVLFRQERVGQYGGKFTFLKFRSMYVNNDDRIHRDYIRQLMEGKSYEKESGNVFKITNDPRVTPLGRFLRKSSLDELPQFFNVLAGDMSLVGPRPPIPYEFKDYDPWHRYRLMKRKPGITGLWQVKGRSLTTFDGMVRMDLQYIREWSLWLDIKILLQTPLAVLKCKGAY